VRIVLCVHHRLDADTGAPGVTLRLGDEYAALGHEVEFVSFDDLPRGLPDAAMELLFPEAAAWLLHRRARGADVIDATTGDAWIWARLHRRGTRPGLVTRSHGLEHVFWRSTVDEAQAEGRELAARTRWYHGGWRLREVGASLRASDMCAFTNHADLEYAVAHLGVARERATVVLNGIPAELQGLELRAPDGPLGVAVIGTWASRKGARYAAQALGSVLARRPDVRAFLLGTRVPEREVLAEFPDPVRDRVEVIERYDRAELPRLLQQAHVLLSASLAEGFSLAIPEGMAAGLAPVATALPGTLEIVQNGENGLLVPPADAGALEAALDRVLADPQLLARLRTAAHADAQELTWERIARQNIEVYEAAARS
jgi:glycosyltransferase involved in cell wall biosynthesis